MTAHKREGTDNTCTLDWGMGMSFLSMCSFKHLKKTRLEILICRDLQPWIFSIRLQNNAKAFLTLSDNWEDILSLGQIDISKTDLLQMCVCACVCVCAGRGQPTTLWWAAVKLEPHRLLSQSVIGRRKETRPWNKLGISLELWNRPFLCTNSFMDVFLRAEPTRGLNERTSHAHTEQSVLLTVHMYTASCYSV